MLIVSRTTADKSKNRSVRLREAAEKYLSVYFREMLYKHIDLVDRRLLKDEKIPHEGKIFSIFEPCVEWICKGKKHHPVELGTLTCLATDQWHFAVDWRPEFIKAKRAHSAVESNINELEHRGLDRCPDKGIKGMHRLHGRRQEKVRPVGMKIMSFVL